MAGKRHHYIPRFLQRGFLMNEAKKEYTYMYLNGGGIRPSKIDNVGVEGLFYSVDGESELDDVYTNLENNYATIINKIRSSPFDKINTLEMAEIVSHFEVRTNNLRKSFHSSSKSFLDKMTESFLKVDVLKPIVQNELKKIFNTVGAIDNLMSNLDVPGEHRELLVKNIPIMLEMHLENYITSNLEPIRGMFKLAVDQHLKGVVKKGHINGMIRNISENMKVEAYKNLNYRVISTDFSLILGDSVVFFEFDGLKEFKPFYDVKNTLKSVYLPISSNLFIYGSEDNTVPKLEIINEMSAKCSSDFFIACEKKSHFSSIQGLIGKNCTLLTDDEMHEILKEIIAEKMLQLSP